MDALTLLKHDHDEVKELFEKFREAGDTGEKQRILGEILDEIETHSRVEEEVFYPAAMREDPDVESLVRESLEEHHLVATLISELRDMNASDEQFVAKASVLIENVEQHAEEEESELFPSLRDTLGDERLASLGEELERTKRGSKLLDLSKEELYAKAQDAGVEGRSQMSKEELAEAIQPTES